MIRISSRGTFFYKRVFPVIWFGFLAVFLAVTMWAIVARGAASLRFPFVMPPIVALVMAAFGYFIMKKFVFDIVDEVWDTGDELLVKNGGHEQRVPLSEIMNVSYSFLTSPPRVTLMLRYEGLFGKEITFSPPGRFGFSRDPVITELIERIDARRRA